MDDIIIREANIDDAYNLIRLVVPEFAGRSDESFEGGEYFRKWLNNFKVIIDSLLVTSYVAVRENDLIGVITVYLLPRLELAGMYSVIEDVFVKESERSKGIGTMLFQNAINSLKQDGVKYVTLNVARDNIKGQEFYKRLGFESKEMEMTLRL